MNTTSYSSNYISNYSPPNIDDLARLARETCVYRGRSQSAKATSPAHGRIHKLLSLFKR